MKKVLVVLVCLIGCGKYQLKSSDFTPNIKWEGKGCCSYHQGVCGCAGNRAMCCDGTLSPSCGC